MGELRTHQTDKQALPKDQTSRPEQETIVSRTRQIALSIDGICDLVVDSFKITDVTERKRFVQSAGIKITVDLAAVIGWIERRRGPATADRVRDRVFSVVEGAFRLAGENIPEYAGGVRAKVSGEPSPGVVQNGALRVQSMMVVASLQDWANEIETEDRAKPENRVEADEYSISSVGDMWEIRFCDERGQYANKCIAQLAKVLSHPNRIMAVADLIDDPANNVKCDAKLGQETEMDVEGVKKIKHRIQEIDDIANETGGCESREAEKADLIRKLQEATRHLPSALGKAHHNIASQIRKLIGKLKGKMPKFAAHLKVSLKMEKPDFLYSPNPRTDWKI